MFILPLLLGASLGLAFAPFNLYLLAVLAPAGLFYLWRRDGWQQAGWQGYWFGIGYFASGVHWIYYSVYTYGGTPLFVAVFVNLLLIAFLALYPALLGWLGKRYYGKRNDAFQVLAFALFWAGLEWVRSLFLTGFPWLSLGYSQIDSVMSGFAPLIGVYGISALLVLSAGLAVISIKAGLVAKIALPLLSVIWLCAWLLDGMAWTQAEGEPLSVSIIQANIDQGQKWDPMRRLQAIERHETLTREHWQSDIIIWPETAVPFFYRQARPYLRRLQEDARRDGVALLIGVPVKQPDGRYYNAVLGMGAAQGQYRKQHLVPFGEYVPLSAWLNDLVQFMQIPMSSFSSGRADQSGIHINGLRLGTSICYEDAFPGLIHDISSDSGLLVNVSNDGWFGNTVAPHQHLQIARMRALETGRWLLRATNTGISAIIDTQGGVLRQSRRDFSEVLNASVMAHRGATPYVMFGEAPWLLMLTLLVLADRVKKMRTKHLG